MKSARVLTTLLILILLLGSVPTLGLRPSRAVEQQVDGTLNVHAVEPRSTADAIEPLPFDFAQDSLLDLAVGGAVKPQDGHFDVLNDPPVSSAVQSSASDWHVECVDCPKYFGSKTMTNRSLQLNSAGHPHIAYGGDHLYYAWYDGTEWHYETVDESPIVGEYTSLALDGAGWAHISYCDDFNRNLKYAWYDGTGWQIETIDNVGGMYNYDGGYNSLALDSSAHPHISYFDDTSDSLKYAWHDGTGWRIAIIESVGNYSSNSLTLDGSGYPHISYTGSDSGDLKYAWHDGAIWHIETVSSVWYYGLHHSLALDGSGHPHISYASSQGLEYAWHDGIAWQIETISGGRFYETSLFLDKSGRPHISYVEFGTGTGYLKYAWHDGVDWHTETVDSANFLSDPSLAMDESGRPYISYYVGGKYRGGWIKYAWHDGTGWQIKTADSAGDAGLYTSLALDKSGRPHISYTDGFPGYPYDYDLKYAWHDGTAWHIKTVDNSGDVHFHTSLALDGASRPHISYVTNHDLKYAWYDGSNWYTETVYTVYSEGWVGRYSSLALDELGRPHISYVTTHDLKYTWYDGSNWYTETVDSERCAGQNSSLTLDGSGRPHISYFSCNNEHLLYARHDGTDWQIETVADDVGSDRLAVPGGSASSLALDKSERPHISYYDHSNGDLKYAWHDGTGWQIATVDSEGRVGAYNSLALNRMGQPHISYYDYLESVLKYAWYDGSNWYTETVDNKGWVGRYSSLALDGIDQPHISYFDLSNGDLKYARLIPPLILDKQAEPRDGLRNNGTLTYTLTLSGPGLSVRLWDPLPPAVRYVPGSISGTVTPPAVYSPTAHAVAWQGTLPTDTVEMISFQVTPGITGTGSLDLSLPIVNTAWLTDTENGRSVSATAIVNARRLYLPLVQCNALPRVCGEILIKEKVW